MNKIHLIWFSMSMNIIVYQSVISIWLLLRLQILISHRMCESVRCQRKMWRKAGDARIDLFSINAGVMIAIVINGLFRYTETVWHMLKILIKIQFENFESNFKLILDQGRECPIEIKTNNKSISYVHSLIIANLNMQATFTWSKSRKDMIGISVQIQMI